MKYISVPTDIFGVFTLYIVDARKYADIFFQTRHVLYVDGSRIIHSRSGALPDL